MADAASETIAPATPQEPVGGFALIVLTHLLIRDGCLAACAVAGWRVGGWAGTAAGTPVGWLVGWAVRYAVVFLLAVAFRLAFGGTIWTPRQDA